MQGGAAVGLGREHGPPGMPEEAVVRNGSRPDTEGSAVNLGGNNGGGWEAANLKEEREIIKVLARLVFLVS